MGLFDSYYDPATYQSSGGFIDRMLSQLQTQGQYQPSAGFASNPMDAQASIPAPVQNASIAVGNSYQMPRIGAGFDVQPSPDSAPMQAQAQMQPQTQPAPQAQQGIPAAFLQPTSSGVPGFFRGLAENAHNGIIGGLIGGIAGANGQSAADTHNKQLQAQYQALIAAGVPQQKALLATINPEFAKTIIPQTFGPQTLTPLGEGYVADKSGHVTRAYEPEDKNKLVKIGQDGLGREQYGVFNPSDGSIKPYAAPGAETGNGGGLGNMDLTGKEYLASMPKSEATIVQGMAEGTVQPPSSFAMGKQLWVNRIAAAKNYDPTFDATNWSGRLAGVKDFSAGKSAEMVRSANQALQHANGLLDSMDALNNGDYPLKNYVGNKLNEATGGGAPTAFRLNAHALADELGKMWKGSGLSDTEIRAWESNLSENMSPEQQRAAVGKLKDLLQGSLQALDEKRVASMGQMAADKAGPIIKPEGQKVLQRIDTWLSKGTGAAQGTTPAQTKTGVSWSVVQ